MVIGKALKNNDELIKDEKSKSNLLKNIKYYPKIPHFLPKYQMMKINNQN